MSTLKRRLSRFDRFISECQRSLRPAKHAERSDRPYPAASMPDAPMTEQEQRHAASLMRVNHTGEVCAQALYRGQASVANQPQTRQHLLDAAKEEGDHLHWCATRLSELNAQHSRLDPLWYLGSYALGQVSARFGDGVSLGFVAETEKQVEAHLDKHLSKLPMHDARSHAILSQMKKDEAAHGERAREQGGQSLRFPIPQAMSLTSKVMKFVAYRW